MFWTFHHVSDLGLLFVVFIAFIVQTSRMGTFVQVDNTCAVLCWVKISFLLPFFLLVIPNFPAGELGQGTRGRVSTSEGGSWSPYSSFLLLSLGLGLGFWCLVKHGRLNGKASWRLGIRAVYLAGTGTGSCPTALRSFPYLYLPRKKNENPIFVWGEDISCLSL